MKANCRLHLFFTLCFKTTCLNTEFTSFEENENVIRNGAVNRNIPVVSMNLRILRFINCGRSAWSSAMV